MSVTLRTAIFVIALAAGLAGAIPGAGGQAAAPGRLLDNLFVLRDTSTTRISSWNQSGGNYDFIQIAPGVHVTADELADYAATKLAPYKRPTRIVIRETLPRGPTGKILKKELARQLVTLAEES